jgi:hypothetical protein
MVSIDEIMGELHALRHGVKVVIDAEREDLEKTRLSETGSGSQQAKRFTVVDVDRAFRNAGSLSVAGMAAVRSNPQADQQKKEEAAPVEAARKAACEAPLLLKQQEAELLRLQRDKLLQEQQELTDKKVQEEQNQELKLINERAAKLLKQVEDKA